MGLGQSPRVESIGDAITSWIGWEDREPDTITINRWEWRCDSITGRFPSPRNAHLPIHIYPGAAQSLKTTDFVCAAASPLSSPLSVLRYGLDPTGT